ncbi:MAG: hypothetical protein JNJ73_06580 [Hyphomonadaceae bacterium]|nr:hypothetical protein [Hyphomonadaceae bacterium]
MPKALTVLALAGASVLLLTNASAQDTRTSAARTSAFAVNGAPIRSGATTTTARRTVRNHTGATFSRANIAAPLTAGECVGLGGKVVSWPSCASGSWCNTEDRDGVLRGACIDEVSPE